MTDTERALRDALGLLDGHDDGPGISLAVNTTELERITVFHQGLDEPITVGLYTYGYVDGSAHEQTEPKTLVGHASIGWLKRFQMAKDILRAALASAPAARPEGPWQVEKHERRMGPDEWWVMRNFQEGGHRSMHLYSEREARAVCDALNRVAGEGT